MKKKTKAPAPLPNVTLFAEVEHETWIKLTTIAAQAGISRLLVYRMAVEFAIANPNFADHVMEYIQAQRKRAKK